jgi:hypothetical protein
LETKAEKAVPEEFNTVNMKVGFLALCLVGTVQLISGDVSALSHEGIGKAQHKFAQQYVDTELNELLLLNRSHPSSLSERAKWLSYCKYGWKSCQSAIEALFAPTDDREVKLVCMEVKGMDGVADNSDQYVRRFSDKDYSFNIAAVSDCTRDLVDERTYTVSVVFSNCIGNECSARTYVKRNREWCATGWKTEKSEVNIDGIEFAVLDGLLEEKLTPVVGNHPRSK